MKMRIVSVFALILSIACLVISSNGQCPDANWSGSRWSTLFSSATSASSLTINAGQNVLFDVSSATIYSLKISGSLVFQTTGNQNLTVAFIRVEPTGSLIAGSATCPIPIGSKTIITFTGTRSLDNTIGSNPADGVFFGDKGLVVCNDNNGNGGTLRLYGQVNGPSWVRLSATANAGATTLQLDSSVGWTVGDHIVVTSTDFGPVIDYRSNQSFPSLSDQGLVGRGAPDQSEEAVITSVSGSVVTIASPLNFMHWGQGYERAEVGLLTRPIVLQGNPADSSDMFGGHVMIRNASDVKISGVEVTHMGQKGVLGRYPIHFHLNYEHSIGKGFLVANNSIHHNFQRCVTIHASNGIWVGNNVAYITHGHCYFLEDGPEELNVFDQNLGITTIPMPAEGNPLPPTTPADVSPGVFWIANPNNTYTGNVAVGGAFGFWFGMPPTPTGPSALLWPAATTNMRPRYLPLLKFADNVVHSCTKDGLEIDNMPDETLQIDLQSYNPLQGPYVVNGTIIPSYALPQVEAVFERTIAYKNRNHGIWTRGGPIRHTGAKMLDNRIGFNNPPGPSLLENSEIWGETDNVGTPRPGTLDGIRQNPSVWSDPQQIKGHETYDNGGPQFVRNVKFYGFVNNFNASRPAGAFGVLTDGPFGHQTRNRYHSISFDDDNVNRVTIPPSLNDGPKCGTLMITDGSVIAEMPEGGWILSNVTPGLIMLYPDASACIGHPEWNAWACPLFGEGYIQLAVEFVNTQSFAQAAGAFTKALFDVSDNDQYNTPGFRRGGFYQLGSTPSKFHPIAGRALDDGDVQFLVNVAPRMGYQFQLINGSEVPKVVSLGMSSSVGGDWMIVVLPFPLNAAPFTVTYSNYGSGGKNTPVLPVNKTSDLKHLTYYWDSAKGNFYIWLENVQMNSWNTNWGFTDYNYDGGRYVITANGCGTPTCGFPAASAVSSIPSIPSVVYSKENTYRTDLVKDCEDNSQDAAAGKAWAYLDPVERTMDIAIYHNRPNDVKSVKIIDIRRQNRLIVDLSLTLSSPIRRTIPFTYEAWTSLAAGQLQVIVDYGVSGSIGGNLACETASDCVLPPPIPSPPLCYSSEGLSGLQTLPVFLDGPLPGWPKWSSWSWSASYDILQTVIDDRNDTAVRLCGNSSLSVGIQNGALVLGYPSSNQTKPPVPPFTIDTTIYPYFEFWVLPDEQTPSLTLQVYMNGINSQTYGPVVASSDYVLGYAIENTGWTRVRIPMSALGITGTFVLQSLSIRQNGYQNAWAHFHIDEMVFTNGRDGGMMTSGFSSSNLVTYTPAQCKDLVGDGAGDGAGGGSSASVVSSWANNLFL